MGSKRQSLVIDVERDILKQSKELSRASEEGLPTVSLQGSAEPSKYLMNATRQHDGHEVTASVPMVVAFSALGMPPAALGFLSPCSLG